MAENPMTEREFKTVRRIVKPLSRLHVFLYQLTGGRVLGTITGRPVMLVTMKGAKTGKTRTIPLMYMPYKDGVIVVASLGGAPKSPVWYNNLVANPDIVVQYKNKKMNLRAWQVATPRKPQSGRSASNTITSTTTIRNAPTGRFLCSCVNLVRPEQLRWQYFWKKLVQPNASVVTMGRGITSLPRIN